ncbi:MAG: GNAT family N-acetyltransferase [Oscillospiraceae bacterium]|nr:GNAT family N-acetyltransferase [Oscillospiraceae bacterium]
MEIRKAKKDDIEQIKIILDRNFDEIMSEYHSKAIIEKYKSYNTLESLSNQLTWKVVYVAEQNDIVVGTGAFVDFGNADKHKYSVSNLYIMPEYHSQGIGTRIFNNLLFDAKNVNASSFHVPSSRNAISFYEKCGFVIDEMQSDTEDEITWLTMQL